MLTISLILVVLLLAVAAFATGAVAQDAYGDIDTAWGRGPFLNSTPKKAFAISGGLFVSYLAAAIFIAVLAAQRA